MRKVGKDWDVVYDFSCVNKNDRTGLANKAMKRCGGLACQDYVMFLLFASNESANVADFVGAGDSEHEHEHEPDPHYTAFLANTKPHGSSYVLEDSRLPIEYEAKHGSEDEDDLHYMAFLANTKPDGTSYVLQTHGHNIKYELEEEQGYDGEQCIQFDEEDQDNVRGKHDESRGLKRRKISSRKNRITSTVEKQKMKDGILKKKKLRKEGRMSGKRKHTADGNIEEQRALNRVKFMNKGLKPVPKQDFGLEISEREVEILQNVEAEFPQCSRPNPFVPSVDHYDEDDAADMDFRKEVLSLLKRPYDDEEYKKLWNGIKPPKEKQSSGISLLSLHKEVNLKLKMANHDKDIRLNIMRGFFYWLEHLPQPGAFQPWKDAECLQTMPGSS